jgi:EmrB/QacA subfamily drug resistance transporter
MSTETAVPSRPAPPEPGIRHPPPVPAPAAPAAQKWLLPLSVLIIGAFMSVLDTSITNVAIPRMQVDLNAAPDDVQWVVTGFTLALGIAVPLSGWLGDRIGLTRLYLISMLGFAGASALCGLAWDLPSMISFRVLQAVPGAILPVASLTLLFQVVPPAKIGSAMGIYGLGVVVAPAVGPVLGGYLVQYVDWRLIFFINVPIGIFGAVAAAVVFPRIKPTSWPRFDVWGFVAVGYGLFALLLACSEGQKWDWDGYRIRGLLVSGVLSLAVFVVIQFEVDYPLIDLRVFKTWAFSSAIILLGLAVTGLFAVLYFVPLYLQNVQGLQALDAGLVLVPAAIVLVVLMPITGRLYDAIGPRWLVVSGLAIMAYGSFLMAHMSPDTPRADIVIWTVIRNFGVGLAIMPIFATSLSALPPALAGAGSSMNNVMQRVASSLAVAVFSSLGVSASAQLMADRGPLLATGINALPMVAAATNPPTPGASPPGPGALLQLYQAMTNNIMTQTYNNGYYIVGILCALGIPLALTMRSGKPTLGAAPVHVEL